MSTEGEHDLRFIPSSGFHSLGNKPARDGRSNEEASSFVGIGVLGYGFMAVSFRSGWSMRRRHQRFDSIIVNWSLVGIKSIEKKNLFWFCQGFLI
jgi:hypothetical protein